MRPHAHRCIACSIPARTQVEHVSSDYDREKLQERLGPASPGPVEQITV